MANTPVEVKKVAPASAPDAWRSFRTEFDFPATRLINSRDNVCWCLHKADQHREALILGGYQPYPKE